MHTYLKDDALDGTLVDSTAVVVQVMTAWCHRRGLPLEEVLAACHGQRTEDTVATFTPHLDVQTEAQNLDAEEHAALSTLQPILGATAFLHRVQSFSWGIVTSSTEEAARMKLDICRLPAPSVLITADAVAHGKPHPEPFLTAARAVGIPPEQCLVFEDADSGVKSALAAGCSVVLVGDRCQMSHERILLRVRSFEDLELQPAGSLLWQGQRVVSIDNAAT